MEQVIIGGTSDTPSNSSTEYNSICGGAAYHTTESRQGQCVSTAGVIKNLRIRSVAPGSGKHWDYTLMLNGAPTALTVEIADAATSGNDATEIDVVAGDVISLEFDPDSSPGSGTIAWTVMFEGATANESLILCSTRPEGSGTGYAQVMGGRDIMWPDEFRVYQICPTAGTIKKLYVALSANPGSGGDAYRFTVRLNEATVAQSLIVTITEPNTTGNDVVHNLVVAAGDILTVMMEPLNTPSVSPYAHIGMTFVADTDGESLILGCAYDLLHASNTEYSFLCGKYTAWSGTESFRYHLGQECVLKKLHVLLSDSPGAGNKYTFTARVAGGGTVVTEIADAATTGDSGALTDTVANDDYLSLQCVPTSSPTARYAYWGLVGYIEPIPPGWTGKVSGVTNPAKVMKTEVANIAEVHGVA